MRSNSAVRVKIQRQMQTFFLHGLQESGRIGKEIFIPCESGPSRKMPVGVDNEDVERSLCAGELRGQFLDFRIGISPVAAVPVSERIMRGKRLTAEQFRTAPQRGFVVMPESEEVNNHAQRTWL